MIKKTLALNLFLVMITLATIFFPLIARHRGSAFFSLDPDAMYVGNVLSFLKNHSIYYIDHPGTPAIILLSIATFPMWAYSQIANHQQSVSWLIEHLDILYIYLRFAQGIIASVALVIYLRVIQKDTQSLSAQLFAWMSLFSFSFFPYIFSIISGEATNFLLISIWLYYLSRQIRNNQPKHMLMLSIVSGLSLANRLTNLFIVTSGLSLVFLIPKTSPFNMLKIFLKNLLFCSVSFLAGTWVIKYRYGDLLGWVSRLATTTGIHGTGDATPFDFLSYRQSVLSLLNQEFWPVTIFGILTLILVLQIMMKKLDKTNTAILLVYLIIAFGSMIFAKYPLSHYQIGHYFIFVYFATLLLHRYFPHLVLSITLLIFIVVVPRNIGAYYKAVNNLIGSSLTLNSFVLENPAQKGTVWEWGLTGDFALLWGRDWSTGSYDQEFKQVKTNLFSLQRGFLQVLVNRYKSQNLFDLCWDHLYIQNDSLNDFLKIYPDRVFSVLLIPNTKHTLVTSSHCLNPLR